MAMTTKRRKLTAFQKKVAGLRSAIDAGRTTVAELRNYAMALSEQSALAYASARSQPNPWDAENDLAVARSLEASQKIVLVAIGAYDKDESWKGWPEP